MPLRPLCVDQKSARASEIAKYARAYSNTDYRMGDSRMAAVRRLLSGASPGSLLDVGGGRGETLAIARALGFGPITATEVVPALLQAGWIEAALPEPLPFLADAFDVVTCFDVLEHLLPDDADAAIAELVRVARRTLFVTAADYSDVWHDVELHVGRRPYEKWDALIRRHGRVTAMGDSGSGQAWRVDCDA